MKKEDRIYRKTKKYLQSTNDKDIKRKLKTLKNILDIDDKKERYSTLYDALCDYLDNQFNEQNICDFKCNICIKKRTKNKPYENGCCYSTTKKRLCEHWEGPGKCNVRCLACKTFTCNYLKKRGYNYSLNNIYLSKYTLNIFQKHHLENVFFQPKEKVLDSILFKI